MSEVHNEGRGMAKISCLTSPSRKGGSAGAKSCCNRNPQAFVALLLGAFALASPASLAAQSNVTGSIRNADRGVTLSKEGKFSGDAAREIGDQFAACVMNRHFAAANRALAMVPDSQEQYAALYKIFDQECWYTGGGVRVLAGGMEIQMTTNPVSFRNALFKAAVNKSFGASPLLELSAVSIMTRGRNAGMVAFADCVIRLNRSASLRVIGAAAGSRAEADAIAALRPLLSQCLSPGNTVVLTKPSLSAAFSEAYYLEARAAQSAGKH